MTDLDATTWAMKCLFSKGWLAVDAAQAVDALECGIEIRLLTYAELLGYPGYSPPAGEVG